MQTPIDNWKVQIKKGYLEYCILLSIRRQGQLYGLELLGYLEDLNLPLKEGTLYPMLTRLMADGYLKSFWETNQNKGHPRKFYSLTKKGVQALTKMENEFSKMTGIIEKLKHTRSGRNG
jgi:PadR family transcriptional regulator PadR